MADEGDRIKILVLFRFLKRINLNLIRYLRVISWQNALFLAASLEQWITLQVSKHCGATHIGPKIDRYQGMLRCINNMYEKLPLIYGISWTGKSVTNIWVFILSVHLPLEYRLI